MYNFEQRYRHKYVYIHKWLGKYDIDESLRNHSCMKVKNKNEFIGITF